MQSMGSLNWTRLGDFTFTFHSHALEKEMATHSSVLAWRIPGMGEPGGLPSMGSHRVGHDWGDLAAAAATQCLKLWDWMYHQGSGLDRKKKRYNNTAVGCSNDKRLGRKNNWEGVANKVGENPAKCNCSPSQIQKAKSSWVQCCRQDMEDEGGHRLQ